MSDQPRPPGSSLPLLLWLGYMGFVVYGSLVPLEYKALPLEQAWTAFQNIRFFQLGVESRADWISNGVLYVPVAFLCVYFLEQTFPATARQVNWILAATLSIALAFGVEFAQLYFPQRTVSLNDIIAECIGCVLGVALSTRFSQWFETFLGSFLRDAERLKKRLLEAYFFAYLAFALFPYDFLFSQAEFGAKMASHSWGLFIAGESPGAIVPAMQLLAEAFLTLPLGFLLVRPGAPRPADYKRAIYVGAILGTVIELIQIFMASGVSQSLSVLSRIVGVCAGLGIYGRLGGWRISSQVVRFRIPLGLVYLIGLLGVSGWFTSRWHGWDGAAQSLQRVNFVPLYYHYYTTEAKALFSLAAVSLSYLPVAALVWAHKRSAGFAMATAMLLATAVEAGKLFFTPAHPDPTNILLAGASNWIAVLLLHHLSRASAPKVAANSKPNVPQRQRAHAGSPAKFALGGCLVMVSAWVAAFPAFPIWVGLILAACAVAVWYRPMWLFAIIPVALPVFDLAPWSGRFFWDEFDTLLFVGLAVAAVRAPLRVRAAGRSDTLLVLVATLAAVSFAISATVGMLAAQWPDGNAFTNYFSPYNALRIAKAVVWAFLLIQLGRRFGRAGTNPLRTFAWGMAAGLCLSVSAIIGERIAFSGFWNFSDTYRVTGPFSSMHVGGAYIECFLAAGTPFLMLLMFETRHWLPRLAAVALFMATTYALMVTFSRNGYLAFAVAVGIFLLTRLYQSKQRVYTAGLAVGLAGLLLAVAIPVLKGEFAQARIANVGTDFQGRRAHWDDALSIRDPDWATALFGMGVGRYPETNYWRSAEIARAGTYRLERENQNTFLRLGSGDPIYLEQVVSAQRDQTYSVKFDMRSTRPNTRFTVSLCEKWTLTAYNCVSESFDSGSQVDVWNSVEKTLSMRGLASAEWYQIRPVKLSLHLPPTQSTVDIDNLRLESEGAADLISNGNFSRQMDHWFFAADGHLQWHIKSLFVALLFDQGWFGLFAVCAFFAVALSLGVQNVRRGDPTAGAMLAALSSFLVVGLFDTLIDAPRFLLLALLLGGFCSLRAKA